MPAIRNQPPSARRLSHAKRVENSTKYHAKRVENGTKCFAILVIADITKTATQIVAYKRVV